MKKYILNIPIEPLDQRYTKQWDDWFKEAFQKNSKTESLTIYGDSCTGAIKQGGFLDIINTNEYKISQLQKIIEHLKSYDDSFPLVIFFHDIWFPGIQALSYMRDGMEWKNMKIMGCLHSGSYEPNDYITLKGMAKWGEDFENSIFKLVDKIFVATYFHKGIVMERRKVEEKKLCVTGFPIYSKDFSTIPEKEKIVVFPHRLDKEKQPEFFDALKEKFEKEHGKDTGWQFVKTQEKRRSKEEYYKLLERSYIAFSAALHENWGIGMQEALFRYNIPICPDRLSYTELYLNYFRYNNDFESAYQKLVSYMNGYPDIPETVYITREHLLRKGREAIPNIIKEITEW